MRRSRTSDLIAATMFLIFAVSASCTSGTDGRGASSGPSLAAPSPDARAVAEQRALDAYRGMWAAYVAALSTAAPDSPDLARHSAGAALGTLVSGLQDVKRQGLRGRGDVVLSPRVASATPTDRPLKIDVSDCVDTSATSLYKASGEPYQDTPGGRRSMAATVEDVGNGIWKVTSFALQRVGTC